MRSRAVVAIVILSIAAAVAIDRVSPARTRTGPGISVPTQGGALACPFAVATRGFSYLHFANFGTDLSRVRVSIIPIKGKTVVLSALVKAGDVGTMRLTDRVRGAASAVVEYAGGEMVASHLILQREGPGPTGIAEAPCVRSGGPDIAVMPARTLRATTTLALFNPGSADADVSIAIAADGQILHPERLSHRVIPGRSRRDFDIGDFAFDTSAAVAEVHAATGRVVAEALVTSTDGIELLSGQEADASIVALSGISGVGAKTTVIPIGSEQTQFEARLAAGTGPPADIGAAASLDPTQGATLNVPARAKGAPTAYLLTARAGSPLVAGTMWPVLRSHSRDIAALPASTGATRWGAVGALAGRSGVLQLIIACPGERAAKVHVLLVTAQKDLALDFTIEPGRILTTVIGRAPGNYGVLALSDVPVTIGLTGVSIDPLAGVLADGISGIPARAPVPVAPLVDPRAGVPAALPIA